MKRIAFVVQLPREISPGQRFRFEIWEPLLAGHQFQVDTFSFLDKPTYRVLYKKGYLIKKVVGVLRGYVRRLFLLFKIGQYDFVMLQREFAPLGPPIFEWICIKLLKKKVIYDFDDAIWIPNTSRENRIAAVFKCVWKVKYICRWAYKVVGGNEYLCDYALKYNSKVVLLPTCVDVKNHHNQIKQQSTNKIIIGWTGSHSTVKYLEDIIRPLQKIAEQLQEVPVEFVIISNKIPELPIPNFHFIPWKEGTEITDLLRLNIGVMPLTSDAWSEGKCGFKLIQYLSLGIPAVASPIGVNKKIIDHGKNGFLCTTESEWYKALKQLIADSALRSSFGENGRKKVIKEYSIQANAETFLGLFS